MTNPIVFLPASFPSESRIRHGAEHRGAHSGRGSSRKPRHEHRPEAATLLKFWAAALHSADPFSTANGAAHRQMLISADAKPQFTAAEADAMFERIAHRSTADDRRRALDRLRRAGYLGTA